MTSSILHTYRGDYMQCAQFIKASTVPSIGQLTRSYDINSLDRQEDLNNYLRDRYSSYGAGDYFGSKYDPYFAVFQKTMDQHFTSVGNKSRRFRESIAQTSDRNMLKPLVTFESLYHVPPVMYRPVLATPSVYQAFCRGDLQGYGHLTKEDIKPWVEVYARLIDQNGRLDMDPDLPKDQEQHLVWTWTTDDPEMTALQVQDMRRTREFLDYVMTKTEIDPTDPSDIRG